MLRVTHICAYLHTVQEGNLASASVTSPVYTPTCVSVPSVDETPKSGTAGMAQASSCTGTPRSTKQTSIQDDVFQTKAGFVKYLEEHLGSGHAMAEIKAGNYSQEGRRAITGVTASKIRDIYGPVPSTNVKLRVSLWLSEITTLESTSFFDPKTHKGYLNKALENKRRSNPDEKRWTWSKRHCPAPKLSTSTSAEPTSDSTDCELDIDRDGCLRNVQECEFCEGQ